MYVGSQITMVALESLEFVTFEALESFVALEFDDTVVCRATTGSSGCRNDPALASSSMVLVSLSALEALVALDALDVLKAFGAALSNE